MPGHGCLSGMSEPLLIFPEVLFISFQPNCCLWRAHSVPSVSEGPASCLAALHGGRSSGPASPSQQWRPSLVNGSLVSLRPASPHHSPTPPDSRGFTASLLSHPRHPAHPCLEGRRRGFAPIRSMALCPTTTTQPACKQRREGPPGDLQELCQEKAAGGQDTLSYAGQRRFIFKETAGTGSAHAATSHIK